MARVAIDRPDGPIVDALLAAGLKLVVVITPRQVKDLRSRYGAAGNKTDRLGPIHGACYIREDEVGVVVSLHQSRWVWSASITSPRRAEFCPSS